MWTNTYKGFTLLRRPGSNVIEVTYFGMAFPQYFKSLRSAKWRITRYLNSQE